MKWSRITRQDWLKYLAAGCALVATFQAEYTIAMAAHFPSWIAWTVPGALDAYALRAIQSGREVFTAVLAMVAVNAASHLVTAGLIPMDWKLVTAVSAIAPLVLWRVHALRTPSQARLEAIHGVPAGTFTEHGPSTVTQPVHAPSTEPVTDSSTWAEAVNDPGTVTLAGPVLEHGHGYETCDWCGWTECPAGLLTGHKRDTCTKRFRHREPFTPAVPDTVPAHWSDPDACPCLFSSTHTEECGGCDHVGHKEGACRSQLPVLEHGDEHEHEHEHEHGFDPFTVARLDADSVPEHAERAPVIPLRTPSTDPVTKTSTQHGPSTQPEHGHVHADLLKPDDVPFFEKLREHMAVHGLEDVPPQRDVKGICGVGTPRAYRVHKAMLREHTSTEGGRS